MTSFYSIKNYKTQFQYPTLDKIHGQPNLDSILHLVRQLKINAQSVSTTLGGGQLGYLALVISSTSYMTIPNARTFHRPNDPGPFILTVPPITRATSSTSSSAPTISSAVITQQKAAWDEQIRLYNECQAVEQALRQQIIDAIESDFLEAIRNDDTGMVQESIPDIIQHLTKTYGYVSEEDLSDRDDELKNYTYDPSKTVDDVFNKIKKHQELAILMNNPKTDKQLCSTAYTIFNRTGVFQNHLIAWNNKPDNDRTFSNMKLHTRASWEALKKVGALKIQDSSLNQANIVQELATQQQALAQNLREDFSTQLQTTIQDAMNMFQQQEPFQQPTVPPPLTDTSSSNQSLNSTTSTLTLDTLMTTIQDLKKEISSLKNSTTNKDTSDINPRTGKPYRRYCWSHGCCTHDGKHCNNRKTGHKEEATFKKRLGGSNYNCMGTG